MPTTQATAKAKILILKAHANSLNDVEIFLRNREIHFYVTASLKQALAYLLKERPQFFLLAADYPNKKVRLLPQLLKRVLNTSILGFTESSNHGSLFALQELNSEYVLYPPISGPAVLRSITRIEKDLEKNRASQFIDQMNRSIFTKQENSTPVQTEESVVNPEYSLDLKEFKELLQSEEIHEPVSTYTFVPSEKVELTKAPEASAELKEIATFFQGTIESIRQSPRSLVEVQRVGKTSQLACLVVDSSSVKGYLLVAFGDNQKMDEAFMDSLRSGLKKSHFWADKDFGRPSVQLQPMQINTSSVEFIQWAQKNTEFLLRTSHQANEVVAAFLPYPDIPHDFKRSDDGEMCELELKQIVAGRTLEFDVFVYLPNNRKFVLYNKKGRTMFANQRERLLERGVTHVHFKAEDMSGFYLYQAQNYVNSRMAEFTN